MVSFADIAQAITPAECHSPINHFAVHRSTLNLTSESEAGKHDQAIIDDVLEKTFESVSNAENTLAEEVVSESNQNSFFWQSSFQLISKKIY